jgi:transposase
VAEEALRRIAQLYGIEQQGVGLDPPQRLALHQQLAEPALAELHAWLQTCQRIVAAGSGTAKAIEHALKRWPALQRYARSGSLPIDNNRCQRDIRPFTTGRKNWLFSSSVAGANAVIDSIMLTCRACGVEPYAYLRHVLTELPGRADTEDVRDLLPSNYAAVTA